MFDAQTVDLIRSAPPLDGLNLEDLPKQLTRAYSTVVSLRMRLRGAETARTDLADIIRNLETLALTQEAFVAVTPNRPNRAAAAFVSAAAHHLRFSAEMLLERTDAPSLLAVEAIGPEIAATILFLIAGRAADAAQMSRNIRVANDQSPEDVLRHSVIDLARGRLQNIVEREWGFANELLFSEESAITLLWGDLVRGIRALAVRLLGSPDEFPLSDTDPAAVFSSVRDLSVQPVEFGEASQVLSVFAGPHHLASLLNSATDVLSEAGVVNIESPPSVLAASWREFVQKLARRRPYLWPNHREAITAGYLNSGISSVISFPTGAGKSTLAELKIAAARLQQKKVVYLAPTLALVNQVVTDVRRTFPETRTTEADELEPEDLTNIAVMTPERCLTLLGFSPEAFEDVGLLVFDECHLMHPREGSTRRSIDAMLCLLEFLRAVPGTDVLLISAMISNAGELAGWLGDLTGRPVLPLALNWKPTRQARGCVVYPSERIKELNSSVQQAARSSTQKSIPKKIKDQLTVQPLGMFSLLQTWQTRDEKDYTLLPLLSDSILLDAAKKTYPGRSIPSAYLTSNRNTVAAAIASRAGDLRIKTLVFAQTIPFCLSIQQQTENLVAKRSVVLTADENENLALASIELGGQEFTYCRPDGLVAVHHGLLLPVERQFNESLFRREDGVHVLVATSTLAQGMNLPSQMVVISGDDRFDVELSKVMLLEAHELLNAAGRAGRAGEAAEGMVILIPGKVIAYDELKTTMSRHWFDLQGIFSNSDQCLKLDDPLEPILDRIHQSTDTADPDAAYLLRRLPMRIGEGEESARNFLGASFAAFRRRHAGDDAWIDSRIESAMLRRRALTAVSDVVTWEDELAATTGILAAEHVRLLAEALVEQTGELLGSPLAWIEWGIEWLTKNPSVFPEMVRPSTIIGVFGKSVEGFEKDTGKIAGILTKIRTAIPLWIKGSPLKDIDVLLTGKTTKKCDAGREWALKLAPELAYFFGLVAQIYRRMHEAKTGMPVALPLSLATHGRCVREGFDHPDKLALHHVLGALVPRVVVHQRFELISQGLTLGQDHETFPDAVQRIRKAWKTRPSPV